MRKLFTSEKFMILKRAAIAITVAAILAMISALLYQSYVKNSRNEAARRMVELISLIQISTCNVDCWGDSDECCSYTFTDGVSETAEAAIMRLVFWGVSPDQSIAFHIMRPTVSSGASSNSFVVFAAHNSVGSAVYVYELGRGGGVKEARENEVYSGISVNSARAALFCYKYNSANKAAPVEKKANPAQFAPDPNDKHPARMIVAVAAE